MGKAAMRKQKRRAEWLANLANSDPDRHREELNKRLNSWNQEIRKRAQSHKGKPGFEIIDKAKNEEAREVLSTCYCRAIAENNGRPHHQGETFRLTNWPRRIGR